ncbi:hypothetical protein QOT17_009616 [Balamuthia mandrillaris]
MSLQQALAEGQALTDEQAMVAAQYQMEAIQHVYSRVQSSCWSKCVTRFGEGDVSVGEGYCAERCVKKYLETSKKVSEQLRKIEQKNTALQQQNAAQ